MIVTLFFSKNTGLIKTYCITESPQNMDYFGIDSVDFIQIYDFINFEYNESFDFIIKNKDSFYIDLRTKELKQKELKLNLKSI